MKCILVVLILSVIIIHATHQDVSGSECSRSVIKKHCSASGDYENCVVTTCSSCINSSNSNPFVLFCPRLVSCTCSVLQEVGCVELAATVCPNKEDQSRGPFRSFRPYRH